MAEQHEEEVQISCSFVTKLPAELRVPSAPIAVPANLTRYGLSQIINHLLALDPARPFDFLIDGELLRLSLAKHLLDRHISTEAVLEIEYVPAVLPPTPKEEHPHEDWVSAIAGLASSSGSKSSGEEGPLLASGSYDGVVRLWRDGECSCSFTAHKGPIQAAVAVPSRGGEGPLLLTAGNDGAVRLWRGVAAAAAGGAAPEAAVLLKGHTDTVQGAAVAPDGNLCATGGWDSRLLLWRCGDAALAAAEAAVDEEEVEAAAAGKKKRKVANGLAVAQHVEAPRSELAGHSQCVSGAAWPTAGTLVSASWDHSVRLWDVEAATATDTFNHNKAVHCVGAAPGGAGLVAFGGAERALRVWDPRMRSGEGLAVKACSSHAGWISAVAWHPSSAHHVATASHDGTAKLWDLRTSIPLHTLEGHTDKVLSAAWVAPDQLATGGADCKLRVAEVSIGGQ
ncbi:ribosome biogenesis WDR12-like protein [Chlorella sorokiniana]|uniref:Ribosome biogenesis protein WDR12 homolog n=1 Tax=Chlorella sorokiniana TaxID=3076 RepID=A0A2P6TGE9_CHLSO|nr:ribosome biogenesis WDR12-like protein [Chlorella sorokiniana]|eukprot:PRW33193.1 ribosome biogenesis WDR12-like protein [Chlorella sorokiniana]